MSRNSVFLLFFLGLIAGFAVLARRLGEERSIQDLTDTVFVLLMTHKYESVAMGSLILGVWNTIIRRRIVLATVFFLISFMFSFIIPFIGGWQ